MKKLLLLAILAGCSSSSPSKGKGGCPDGYTANDQPPLCVKIPADFKRAELHGMGGAPITKMAFTRQGDVVEVEWFDKTKRSTADLVRDYIEPLAVTGNPDIKVLKQGALESAKGQFVVTRASVPKKSLTVFTSSSVAETADRTVLCTLRSPRPGLDAAADAGLLEACASLRMN